MSDSLEKRTAPIALVEFAKSQIHQVLMDVKGVEFIMISSTDGFELASLSRVNTYNSTKLAAVSSSILAMVGAFLGEINLSGCQSISLDAQNGRAILTSVPTAKHPMVIVTLVSKDVLLAQLLNGLKDAGNAIMQQDYSSIAHKNP